MTEAPVLVGAAGACPSLTMADRPLWHVCGTAGTFRLLLIGKLALLDHRALDVDTDTIDELGRV